MAITLYTNPMSRGRIARWALEEVGQPYDVKLLQYGAEMKSPEFLAINPMGKVPALVHDGMVITECPAICAYLADAFPEANLAPPLHQRADYYRWFFFAAGPLEAAASNRSMGFEVPEEKQRMVGYGSYATVLNVLEEHLSKSVYLTGDQFTAADICAGSQLMWGMQFGSIETRSVFQDYVSRTSQRPAHQRASELDDSLIQK